MFMCHASFLFSDAKSALALVSAVASDCDCEVRATRTATGGSGVNESSAASCWKPGRCVQLCDEGMRRRPVPAACAVASAANEERVPEESAAEVAEEAEPLPAAVRGLPVNGGRMETARARRPSSGRNWPRSVATNLPATALSSVNVLPQLSVRNMHASTSTCHSRHVGSHAMHNSTHALYA